MPALTPAQEALLLDARAAAAALGVSRSQFFRLHSAGKLPLPVRLGTRCPRWRADELRQWVTAGCSTRAEWLMPLDGEGSSRE